MTQTGKCLSVLSAQNMAAVTTWALGETKTRRVWVLLTSGYWWVGGCMELVRWWVLTQQQCPLDWAELASIRTCQVPPPKVSCCPETPRATPALHRLVGHLSLLSCKKLSIILKDLYIQLRGSTAFPGGCALWEPTSEEERGRGVSGLRGRLESKLRAPDPLLHLWKFQFPHL